MVIGGALKGLRIGRADALAQPSMAGDSLSGFKSAVIFEKIVMPVARNEYGE